jgi:hypothetical protein
MTIGIAAFGPRAGKAVFDALRAVESVAWGAVRGFAAFVVITGDGRVLRHSTQRGGTSTLFVDGERTGVEPPAEVARACLAAVMSSGPDRPEPLSQFVAADPKLGLVTGHRLPNVPGVSGRPINLEVLERMREGASVKEAVDSILDANPEADAGVIAADLAGRIYGRNSDRVSRRPDLGKARRTRAGEGAVVEVMHNAIYPSAAVADLAADIAMETMLPLSRPDGWITVNAGTPLEHGGADIVLVGPDLVATKVVTTDLRILSGRWNCAAIYLGSEVRVGPTSLGTTSFEPYVVVEDGRIVSMSGQISFRLGFRRHTGIGAGSEVGLSA